MLDTPFLGGIFVAIFSAQVGQQTDGATMILYSVEKVKLIDTVYRTYISHKFKHP